MRTNNLSEAPATKGSPIGLKNLGIKPYEKQSLLSTFSSDSKYEDDTWVIDKLYLNENKRPDAKRVYFGSFKNPNLLPEVREWALIKLLEKASVAGISNSVGCIRKCMNYLVGDNKIMSFKELSNKDIAIIYDSVFNSGLSLSRSLSLWHKLLAFFEDCGYRKPLLIAKKFILSEYPERVPKDEKYIPNDIIERLDVIFKCENNIPEPYRLIYWTLRLIPNRITEVLSMKQNCLKYIGNDTYIISIPTFKQTGPHTPFTIKLIQISYVGIGQYFIDLIKNQIRYSKNLSMDNDFLFNSHWYRIKNGYKYHEDEYQRRGNKTGLITPDMVNRFFKKLCERNKIKDQKDRPYYFTSHMFRHNAITDRLSSGIFRPIDIMQMTQHHNTEMIQKAYNHPNIEKQKEGPIIFRGKVINTDNPKKIEQLLLNPYAFRLHNLGICSDTRGCDSDKYACLKCAYLVPRFEDLDYYYYEIEEWEKKREFAIQVKNNPFRELCDDWLEAYRIIVNRVLGAVSNDVEL